MRSQPSDISTGYRKLLKSTMSSMARDPRARTSLKPDPVVVMVAVVVVAAVLMLGNPQNILKRAGRFHFPQTSVGDMGNQDIRKVNTVKLWKQSAVLGKF